MRRTSQALLGVLAISLAGMSFAPLQPEMALESFGPSLAQAQEVRRKKPVRGLLDANQIRVGISDDDLKEQEYPTSTVSASGPFEIRLGSETGRLIHSAAAWQQVRVSVNSKGFYLRLLSRGNQLLGPFQGPILVKPKSSQHFVRIPSITRKGSIPSYRGYFEITRGFSSPAKLSVVNVLDLNDYLRAVVPNELPIRFGFQAVKAQSVAARNYAIRPREKPWPQFDICDSQYCQAYYGKQTESDGTNQAVRETEGLIALYQGMPILALYSSSHGGVSEDYSNAFSEPETDQFPAQSLPFLSSRADYPRTASGFGDLSIEQNARAFWTAQNLPSFDVNSSYYRWNWEWSRSDLERIFKKTLVELSENTFTKNFIQPHFAKGQSFGQLKRIIVTRRGRSGKAMELQIVSTRGTWTLQKEFVIRKAFLKGRRALPSANIAISHLTDSKGSIVKLRVQGGGFGHGVGMSQYGASYLSKQGKTFDTILQHYYSGIALGSIPLKGQLDRGSETHFYGATHRGILWVKADQPLTSPVRLELNGQGLELDPFQSEQEQFNVTPYIKVRQKNNLILQPHPQGKTLKVWVELFPKHSG